MTVGKTDPQARAKKKTTSKAIVTRARIADDNHRVLTVVGGSGSYRRTPCSGCPWRQDTIGDFPPETFRLSANTAYDMSDHHFGCHESGPLKPATCAGFLLQGSAHNLFARLGRMRGTINDDVHAGGHPLHASYRDMAVANGVDPDDPVLAPCQSNVG